MLIPIQKLNLVLRKFFQFEPQRTPHSHKLPKQSAFAKYLFFLFVIRDNAKDQIIIRETEIYIYIFDDKIRDESREDKQFNAKKKTTTWLHWRVRSFSDIRGTGANLGERIVRVLRIVSGTVAQVRLRNDFGVLQLDDCTRLVVVFRERWQQVLASMEFVTVNYNLPQCVCPRDLELKKKKTMH